jgi:hypothetical protein
LHGAVAALRFSKKVSFSLSEVHPGEIREKTVVVFSIICGRESAEASALADMSASYPIFVTGRKELTRDVETRANLVPAKPAPD